MAQIKKKVTILKKQEQKKSKWRLWLFFAMFALVVVIFLVVKYSSNENNKIVSDKIELATTKTNEIATELQNPNVNFDEAKAKVAEAQKAVNEAEANAKTDEEKQAIAETQTKVDKIRQTVEQEKTAAETKAPVMDEAVTLVNDETVASGQPATTSAVPAKPAQSSSEKSVTTPAKSGESVTSKTASSTTPAPALPQGTLEEKAKKVIRGDFGNGVDRKQSLGSEYVTIQQKVNEMYRNGEV
jgi:hypothetical protein